MRGAPSLGSFLYPFNFCWGHLTEIVEQLAGTKGMDGAQVTKMGRIEKGHLLSSSRKAGERGA